MAVALAAMASAVYRLVVSPQFVAIRVQVVASETYPTRHVVEVPLPDLSTLRGHPAVLGMHLSNTRAEPRRVGLLRDGFPASRILLSPRATVDWNLVLTSAQVEALARDAASATRPLELTGDADGWALTALDFRNYRWRWGEPLLAVGVPRQRNTPASGSSFVAVAILLSLLSLIQTLGLPARKRLLRLAGDGLTLIAVSACVACLFLPRLSLYQVLLSPLGFVLLAAGLFAPILLYTATALVGWTPSVLRASTALVATTIRAMTRLVARYWSRHPIACERGAALLALVAIAVAQPVFDVVSNSPEFFTARGTPPSMAVVAVLAISLGIPLALLGIERAISFVNPRAASAFQSVLVALLSAAIVMPLLRRYGAVTSPTDALIAAFVGLAVAFANARLRVVRQFLTALSPAALVVPGLFLSDPGVAHIFLPSESPTAVQTVERTPPIVLVVFDELPLNSLLDADEKIDAERYPNFAALARDAYWFRNASTVSSETLWAVPAILSGRYPTAVDSVPTLRYYPVNLFTTLARHYEIFASLRFEGLCPAQACEQNAAIPDDTVRSLLTDLSLVWLHIVAPQGLADALPPIVGDWAQFGQASGGERRRTERPCWSVRAIPVVDRRGSRRGCTSSISCCRTWPSSTSPSGRVYRAPDYQTTNEDGKALFERASQEYADTLQQRHLAQVGFVDHLIGDLIARLRKVGVYDSALLVVTADHGASFAKGAPDGIHRTTLFPTSFKCRFFSSCRGSSRVPSSIGSSRPSTYCRRFSMWSARGRRSASTATR